VWDLPDSSEHSDVDVGSAVDAPAGAEVDGAPLGADALTELFEISLGAEPEGRDEAVVQEEDAHEEV
jgi:hypothetical protein